MTAIECEALEQEFAAAHDAYHLAYQAGGEVGAERDAYYAIRRKYNTALNVAVAEYRRAISPGG